MYIHQDVVFTLSIKHVTLHVMCSLHPTGNSFCCQMLEACNANIASFDVQSRRVSVANADDVQIAAALPAGGV